MNTAKLMYIAKLKIAEARAKRKGLLCEDCLDMLDDTSCMFREICGSCNTILNKEFKAM
jgi:hypothetical protein